MEIDDRSRRKRRMLWGLFIMALGGAFLLARSGLLGFPPLWMLWPGIFLVIGASHALDGRPGSAAMFALMGGAFFAAELGWKGLGYHNFWPLLLIAVGVGIVIRAISGEDAGRRRREA